MIKLLLIIITLYSVESIVINKDRSDNCKILGQGLDYVMDCHLGKYVVSLDEKCYSDFQETLGDYPLKQGEDGVKLVKLNINYEEVCCLKGEGNFRPTLNRYDCYVAASQYSEKMHYDILSSTKFFGGGVEYLNQVKEQMRIPELSKEAIIKLDLSPIQRIDLLVDSSCKQSDKVLNMFVSATKDLSLDPCAMLDRMTLLKEEFENEQQLCSVKIDVNAVKDQLHKLANAGSDLFKKIADRLANSFINLLDKITLGAVKTLSSIVSDVRDTLLFIQSNIHQSDEMLRIQKALVLYAAQTIRLKVMVKCWESRNMLKSTK